MSVIHNFFPLFTPWLTTLVLARSKSCGHLLCSMWVLSISLVWIGIDGLSVILAIRTWAIWQRTRTITALLVFLSLVSLLSTSDMFPSLKCAQAAVIPSLVVVLKDLTTHSRKSPGIFVFAISPSRTWSSQQDDTPWTWTIFQTMSARGKPDEKPMDYPIYRGNLLWYWWVNQQFTGHWSCARFTNKWMQQWHWVFRSSWSRDCARDFLNPSDRTC